VVSDTKKPDWRFYIDELKSNGCACDRWKGEGHSFCKRCYDALPPDMQRNLYRALNRGYEEAYEEAKKYLEENVWPDQG
jgi:hypothetical protein